MPRWRGAQRLVGFIGASGRPINRQQQADEGRSPNIPGGLDDRARPTLGEAKARFKAAYLAWRVTSA